MYKEVKWVLVVIAALALQGETASEAEAMDPPLPRGCERPNLNPQAQARCDFIARNLCRRSGLSEPARLFCDRIRFAKVPHHNLVRLARNGAVRSIHLIDTKTGEKVFTAYPYGIAFAALDEHDREVRMKTKRLERFLRGRPTPAGRGAAAPSGFATGLPIGWNESTGVAPGQCLNYTIATPSNNVEQASFSSQNTASSTAEQIKISTTVSGAYDAFKASDTFSYSDNYQSSASSSNQYYNFYSLYTLNSTVPPSNPLTSQGQNAGTSFDTLCGSEYMESVPVGMVATISINYGSSSQSTQQSISDSFKVSFGLDSVSAAVSTSTEDSSSSSYFTFSMIQYGGGTAAAKDLSNAFAATNSSGEAYYALCAGGDTDACTQFTSSMGTGAAEALDSFNSLVGGLSGATNPDLSSFESFPNGVAGASTTQLVTTAIPSTSNDLLADWRSRLQQYTDVLNQVATLANRAAYLADALGEEHYNPTDTDLQLDLQSLLADEIVKNYSTARAEILNGLASCLNAKSTDDLDMVCQAVDENSEKNILTAYDWYKANPVSNVSTQQLLLQNTIGLQYTGIYTNDNSSSWPQDVVYVEELPSWDDVNDFVLIGSQAALVGFADAAYVNGSNAEQAASLSFLPLKPTADLSEVVTEVFTTRGTQPPGLWYGWLIEAPAPGTNDLSQPLEWKETTTSCHPSADDPCEIWYGMKESAEDFPLSFRMTPIEDLFPKTGD